MNDKVALLTGGSSDIAKSIAKQLSENGFKVILTSRHIEADVNIPDTSFVKADLTNQRDIENLIESISTIDLLINIAGIWHNDSQVFAGKDYDKFEPTTIRNTMEVGIMAPMQLVHGLIPKFSKDANIINLSGTFENGGKGWLSYYVSKKALEDFTYGLADELKDKGIRVNGISPSDTATTPYAKFFPEYIEESIQPSQIARLVLEVINSKRTGTIQVIKKYTWTDPDKSFLLHAIKMAQQSYDEGSFPAGAVIVKDGKVITETTSASFPKINFHAESKAIDNAINELNEQLSECTLYASMEPCLMCLSRAYWAGVRRIVFAVKKESVPHELCYESNHNHYDLLEKFNQKIEFVHIKELENEALVSVSKWLEANS